MSQGRVAVGHPVDVASGAVFTINHDFAIPGGVPIVWRRYYSSDSAIAAWQGQRWMVPYFMRLDETEDGYWLLDEEGNHIPFRGVDGLLADGETAANLAAAMELTRTQDVFTVHHWHAGGEPIVRFAFVRHPAATSFPLAWQENLAGQRLLLEYDLRGRPIRLVQELERRAVELAYDADDLITAAYFIGDRGREQLAEFVYDAARRLVASRDALGHEIRYSYDAEGRMVRETAPLGGSFYFEYDQRGRCVHTLGDGGVFERRLQYHDVPRMTRVTDGLGAVTEYYLNVIGQVLQEISPRGGVTTTEYDEHGRRVSIVDSNGGGTTFVYDGRGNRVQVVDPSGAAFATKYNARHLPLEITTATGVVYRYEYDARGILRAMIDPLGRRTTYERDERGLLTQVNLPGGQFVRRRYGERFRWLETSDALGLVQHVEFDDRGNPVSVADAEGVYQRFYYDALNRIVRIEPVGASPVEYQYNPLGGVLECVGPPGQRERWAYDSFGELVAQQDSSGAVMRLEYDAEVRLVAVVNRVGERMELGYDADGNVSEQRFFDGRVERYTYDLAGYRTQITAADGSLILQKFDSVGNLVARESEDGTLKESFTYTPAGRMASAVNLESRVEFEWDAVERLTSEVQNGRRVEYTYDEANNRVARRLAGGSWGEVRMAWDVRGRLTQIADAAGVAQQLEWDRLDRLVERRTAGGVRERFTYNPARRLHEQVVTTVIGAPIVRRRYTYDTRENLTVLHDELRGTLRYEHDALNRVTRVVHNEDRAEQYQYDANSAIVRTSEGPRRLDPGARTVATPRRSLAYDELGQIARTEEGALTTTLRYDLNGQLVDLERSDGTSASFTYDALGRRLSKEVNGVLSEFTWDGSHYAAEWLDGQPKAMYLQFDHETLACWLGAERIFPIRDRTGAVWETVTESGRPLWSCTLDLFGAVISERGAAASPFRFRGQYHDRETGLSYNFYRTYDPRLGDYITPDPIGLEGGANFYAYPRNPLDWDDPFGLTCTNRHKGQMGERRMDRHYRNQGFEPIHTSGRPRGIDGVYRNTSPTGKPRYIIVESKYGSSQPRRTRDGNMQLSDGWIDAPIAGSGPDRLTAAVGPTQAARIERSAQSNPANVERHLYQAPAGSPGSSTNMGSYTPGSGNTEI
jgi:RHS repeat-associated protein